MFIAFSFLLCLILALIFFTVDPSENYHIINIYDNDEKIYEVMQSTNNSSKTCLYYSKYLNNFETKFIRSLDKQVFDKQYVENKNGEQYSLENRNGICTFNPGF